MKAQYVVMLLIVTMFSHQGWAPPPEKSELEKREIAKKLAEQASKKVKEKGAHGGAGMLFAPEGTRDIVPMSFCRRQEDDPILRRKIKIGTEKSCLPNSTSRPFFYRFTNENVVPVYIKVDYKLNGDRDWGSYCLFVKAGLFMDHACEHQAYTTPPGLLSANVSRAVKATR